MENVVIGVLSNRESADRVISDLKDSGYKTKDISVITREDETIRKIEEGEGRDIAGGAVSGAATGGIIGGIADFLLE